MTTGRINQVATIAAAPTRTRLLQSATAPTPRTPSAPCLSLARDTRNTRRQGGMRVCAFHPVRSSCSQVSESIRDCKTETEKRVLTTLISRSAVAPGKKFKLLPRNNLRTGLTSERKRVTRPRGTRHRARPIVGRTRGGGIAPEGLRLCLSDRPWAIASGCFGRVSSKAQPGAVLRRKRTTPNQYSVTASLYTRSRCACIAWLPMGGQA